MYSATTVPGYVNYYPPFWAMFFLSAFLGVRHMGYTAPEIDRVQFRG